MVLQFALGERAAFERTEARWLAIAERSGSAEYADAIGVMAERCYEYGRWDDALVYTDSVAEEIRPGWFGSMVPSFAYRVALRREQPELAARYLDATGFHAYDNESTSAERPPMDDMDMSDIRAMQAAARGDRDQELYWRRWWLTAPKWAQVDEWPYIMRLLWVALELDDPATVSAVLQICHQAPDTMPWRLATRCCRALIGDDTDELLALAEEYRLKGWTLVHVEVLEEAAVRLARAGDAEAARTTFAEVVGFYDGLGAGLDVRRVNARMRPYGIRTGPRSPHRRTSSGWAALTPAEQRVARLAAGGLSNPDIARQLYLSRNTIQSHVSSILAKLQIRSRGQLRDTVPAA
jgi:DNA-binding CsgD family transcriptional regulator